MRPRGFPAWPDAAAALAAAVPPERLHPAARSFLAHRPASDRWAVALSGGADSVALLLLTLAHWPRRHPRLLALHFDHGLRGAASTADARFCARLCAALGVELVSARWRSPDRKADAAGARTARFGFFEATMRRRRVAVLLLAHHQDDVAESQLMRLARGSGTAGLAAPRPVHALPLGPSRGCYHVRPLLALRKAEIAAALRARRLPWREDASNAKGVHFRNRVRADVMPAWIEASQRDAVAGAARSRELLEEDDDALELWARELRALKPDRSLDVAALAGRPKAVARRVLHRWLLLQPWEASISRQAFEALLEAVLRGLPTRHSMGKAWFAVIRRGWLRAESGTSRK